MWRRVTFALNTLILLFAESPSHPVVPLGRKAASARKAGQGRPPAGASRAPLTAASMLEGWRRGGDRTRSHYTVLLLAAALSFGSGSTIAIAQSTPIMGPASVDLYAAHIAEASQRFGIPKPWIRAVLRAESAGDARAISSAGAMGLMQVMPDTWAGLRIRHRLGRDPLEPRDNILAGTAYLREMFNRYGNAAAMLAAYNAGPARYDEYLATGRALPAETHTYIAALVPVLSGSAASEALITAPAPPPDWREAPLFVMHSTNNQTAATQSSDAQSRGTNAAAPVHDPADTEPQDGDIFVVRASDGGTP